MSGLYKEAWAFGGFLKMNPEFSAIHARREAELNSKYRNTIEQLGLSEDSPMHQYLKHHWDKETEQLKTDYAEGFHNQDEYIQKYRKFRQESPSPSSSSPESEPTSIHTTREGVKQQERQEKRDKGLGLAGGTITATGLAGLSGAGGYAAVQGGVPHRNDEEQLKLG